MRQPHHTRHDGEAGFTIIETLVASVLLLVGLGATLTLVENAASTTQKTRTREQATSLQREVIEGARSAPYDQLTPSGAATAIRARPALGDASGGSGWTINRRNATYTVSVGVCTVDDPRDGLGTQEPGVFCAVSGGTPSDGNADGILEGLASGTGTTCTIDCDPTPADYKRLVSVVTWPGGSNTQSAQINSPGLSAAPAVTNLAVAASVTDPSTQSLGATVTTTGNPATVNLYVDGAFIATAGGSANSWSGSWTLGPVTLTAGAQPAQKEVLDGSYELSAKAFDKYGQYGVMRTQVIEVNRRVAFAPARVEAGRNGGGVEVEWSPAKEGDSVGFQVERRVGGGAWETVCALKVATTCRDAAAPAAGGAKLEYSVVGYDRNAAGQPRAGDRSAPVEIVDPAPAAPGPPPTFSATRSGGDVVLTWTAPADATAPDHYNIYRDGAGYASRLASVYVAPGGPLTYTDRAGGTTYTYRITSVNGQLGESAMVGPVTG